MARSPLGMRWVVALLLVGCAGTGEPLAAAPETAEARYQRTLDAGRRWERAGSPDAATLYFQRAVVAAQQLPQPDVRLARARYELGDALRRQARLAEAEQELRRAGEDLARLGEAHPDLEARILDALGYCQLASGHPAEATETLDRALRLRMVELGAADAATAETRVHLAEAHHRSGRSERALDLLLDAATLYRELGPEYRIRFATVHDNMGRIYRDLGRYPESERLHLRAIELARRVQEEDNPNVAIFQRSLASLYVVTGREAESEALYRESLATLERTLGSEHYETRATRAMLERTFPDAGERS